MLVFQEILDKIDPTMPVYGVEGIKYVIEKYWFRRVNLEMCENYAKEYLRILKGETKIIFLTEPVCPWWFDISNKKLKDTEIEGTYIDPCSDKESLIHSQELLERLVLKKLPEKPK